MDAPALSLLQVGNPAYPQEGDVSLPLGENNQHFDSKELLERDDNVNILVHMAKDEVKNFSRAQGGVDINPELGIPQFTHLWEIMKNSEVKKMMQVAIKGYLSSSENQKKSIHNELDDYADETLGDEENIRWDKSQEDPEAQMEAQEGTRDDTELVLMPKKLVYFIWDQLPEGYQETNPNTGYPQFGLLSFLGTLAGGVVGFCLGGPAGAAIGSGLSNLATNVIEDPQMKESSFMDKLIGGGLAAAGGYFGGQMLGGAGGGAATGAGSATGAGASSGGGGILSTIGSLFGGGGASAASGSGLGGGTNLMSQISSVLPYGMLAYGAYKDSQNQDKHRDLLEKNYNANKADFERDQAKYRKLMGMDSPLWGGRQAPTQQHAHYRSQYKTGGQVEEIRSIKPITSSQYIKGDEPGQADNIHVDVPKGSRVIDADCVSKLGDGTSEAGAKKLYELCEKLPSSPVEDSNMVPCALSAGEFVITPDKVAAIGKGSLAEGHKILDNFVKKIRAYKKHSVNDIPKESKSLSYFLGRQYNHILAKEA